VPGVVEEDVVGFDISMDDALFMERLNGQDLRRAGGAFRILLEEACRTYELRRVKFGEFAAKISFMFQKSR